MRRGSRRLNPDTAHARAAGGIFKLINPKFAELAHKFGMDVRLDLQEHPGARALVGALQTKGPATAAGARYVRARAPRCLAAPDHME